MPVDRFDIERFDAALPRDKKRGDERIFTMLPKLRMGEYCWEYQMPNGRIRILVRSSIDKSGVSADTGEDSIRLMIERRRDGDKWYPISKGPDAYTTRVPGWEKRLAEKIKEIHKKAMTIKKPFDDGDAVYFVKDENSRNLGRPFASREGNFDRWLD